MYLLFPPPLYTVGKKNLLNTKYISLQHTCRQMAEDLFLTTCDWREGEEK